MQLSRKIWRNDYENYTNNWWYERDWQRNSNNYLIRGHRVIVIGSSSANGDVFYKEATRLGAEERAIFLQANLSLIEENKRIIKEIKSQFESLDKIVFCAVKHSTKYIETDEGLELTFALYYISRFILSYGLKELLEKSENPIILNICAPGMKGEIDWDDLQHQKDYKNVSFHGSRLNDLLGVCFAQNDDIGKVKYVLYNPWAVKTEGVFEMYNSRIFMKAMLKLSYKIIGKSVEKAIIPITEILDNPPIPTISAFRERKKISLAQSMFDKEKANRLHILTSKLLNNPY